MVKKKNKLGWIIGVIILFYIISQQKTTFTGAMVCTSEEPDTLEGFKNKMDGWVLFDSDCEIKAKSYLGITSDSIDNLLVCGINNRAIVWKVSDIVIANNCRDIISEFFEDVDSPLSSRIYKDKTIYDNQQDWIFCNENLGFFTSVGKQVSNYDDYYDTYFNEFYTCQDIPQCTQDSDCDDGNDCTDDGCVDNQCVHTQVECPCWTTTNNQCVTVSCLADVVPLFSTLSECEDSLTPPPTPSKDKWYESPIIWILLFIAFILFK